jgi:hypothetical protein
MQIDLAAIDAREEQNLTAPQRRLCPLGFQFKRDLKLVSVRYQFVALKG